MKIRYLVLVSLMLAILTIGAASASYDADTLAVDDDAGDAVSQADDIDVIAEGDDSGNGERAETDNYIDLEDGDELDMNNPDEYIGVEISDNDATGNVTIAFNGSVKYNEPVIPYSCDEDTDEEQGGNYLYLKDIDDLKIGIYAVEVNYTGDSNYKPFSETFTVNIIDILEENDDSNYRFYVDFDDDRISYGNNVTCNIYYPYNANGEVIITYNGKTITKRAVGGEYGDTEIYVDLSDLKLGENNITFTFKDDNYPEKSVVETVYVYAKFVVPGEIRYNNEEDVISLLLPSDAKGNLIISKFVGFDEDDNEIREVIGKVALVDGKANASLSSLGLGVGFYQIKVEYDGDDYASYIDEYDEFGEYDGQYSIFIVPDVIYKESVYINGTNSIKVVLPDNGTDNLTVSIKPIITEDEFGPEYGESKTIYNEVANGTLTIQLPKLEAGNHVLEVRYGDSYTTYNFEVRENNPEFDLNVTFPDVVSRSFDGDDDVMWNVSGIPENADGKIQLYINGKLYDEYEPYYDESYNDEYYFYGFSLVKFGEYNTWEVKLVDDSYYNVISKNGTFYADWVVIPKNVDNHDELLVSLDDKKGFVQFDIDGKNYATEILDGSHVLFEIEGLSIGNHTYEISYFDENNVKQLTKSGSFKTDYYIYVGIYEDEYTFTKEFELNVYVPEDATGIITVSVDGKNYTATPVNGTATVILKGLVMGKNNVTVSYVGDSKYPAKELKNVINMTGYGIIVEYDGESEMEQGTFEYVSISLPENAVGNLLIYNAEYVEGHEKWDEDKQENVWIPGYWASIGGEPPIKSVKLENGFAKINASQFGFGIYKLIAAYEPVSGPDYEVEIKAFQFNIAPEINLTNEIVVGENATVIIVIPDATGVINVYEDSDDEEGMKLVATISSDNGTFKGEISGLTLGEHVFYFEYVGEDMENMFDNNMGKGVNVNPKKAEIPEKFNADGSGEIALELPEGANGTVSVYEVVEDEDGNEFLKPIIENATYTSENKSVAISGLKTGEHDIKLVYKDDKNGVFEKGATITVPKPDAGVNFTIPETVSGDTLDINLPKDATGNVLVTVDGKASMIPIVNGSAKFDLSKLADGAHTISVIYPGDGNYSAFEKSANVTIQRPVDPKITASNLNILYTASTKYTATIYGTDGKVAPNTSVTFLINGKVYKTVTTNAKGIASVTLNQKPGTYKITTKALGKEVTKILKVKHIVKLQKVKVKRSAKKLVIKVTLAKVNGKYLKGKKVTLKFKGKKYTAKTNKKGVAKFTIKKNVLKKLKKGKKVTYQATYLKDTVKRTVKVKK